MIFEFLRSEQIYITATDAPGVTKIGTRPFCIQFLELFQTFEYFYKTMYIHATDVIQSLRFLHSKQNWNVFEYIITSIMRMRRLFVNVH